MTLNIGRFLRFAAQFAPLVLAGCTDGPARAHSRGAHQ